VAFRHIALRVWYDGREYSGLASQGEDALTVEDVIIQAAKEAFLLPADADLGYFRLERAGRTDRGVSGSAQIVSLYLRCRACRSGGSLPVADQAGTRESEGSLPGASLSIPGELDGIVPPGHQIPQRGAQDISPPVHCQTFDASGEIDYVLALNAKLPPQVRITGWAAVPHSFSPRFSASARTYSYVFGDPCGLDLRAMLEACSLLIGEHDFRNICRPDPNSVHSFIRTIIRADLLLSGRKLNLTDPPATLSAQDSDVLILEICGSGFLYHQVRCIASLLLHVGGGLEDPGVVATLLDVSSFPAPPDYPIAPPEQLIFTGARYTPELSFCLSEKACRQLDMFFSKRLAQTTAMSELCAQGLQQIREGSGRPRTKCWPNCLLRQMVPRYGQSAADCGVSSKDCFPSEVVPPTYKRIAQRRYDDKLAKRIADSLKAKTDEVSQASP